MPLTKRSKHDATLFERGKIYSIPDAIQILKKGQATKFDSSVDIQVKLLANADSGDQIVRGTCSLPFGTGRPVRVVVLTKDEAGKAAKEAGADEVGGDELIDKISKGWMEFDVVVASPKLMKDIAKLGRVLGPRGLMPSPKAGTVTENLAEAVKEIKKGRVEFKMDKQSNVNSTVGRLSYGAKEIEENALTFIRSLLAAKPKTMKGDYVQSMSISSTMGPGLKLDSAALARQEDSNE